MQRIKAMHWPCERFMRISAEAKILLALIHLGFTFLFIFSAFMALQVIESSLNYDKGLGTLSLSMLYGVNFLSALFIAPPMVKFFTPKWTMLMCFGAHTFFVIAHFWPIWQLLIASSFILGLFYSPAWVSNGTYITVLAKRYAENTGKDISSVLQLFNGVFYLLFSLHGVPGNIASSLILSTSKAPKENCEQGGTSHLSIGHSNFSDIVSTISSPFNGTTAVPNESDPDSSTECYERDISVCGPNHCPFMKEHTVSFTTPDTDALYVLLGTFLGLNLLGLVFCLFLPSGVKTEEEFSFSQVLSALKVMRYKKTLFYAVALFVVFVNESIFYSTFTQSVVGCAYGLEHIGFVALTQTGGFFLVTISSSAFSDALSKRRQLILVSAMILNAALAISWLLWHPQEDLFSVVLVMAAVHGVVHGVYKVQFGAITSLFFANDPEAAFSIYNLVYTTAASFTFGISFVLCMDVKVYIYLGLLVIMALFYGALERQNSKEKTLTITIATITMNNSKA